MLEGGKGCTLEWLGKSQEVISLKASIVRGGRGGENQKGGLLIRSSKWSYASGATFNLLNGEK